jgi:eukaryotic-like serine/threonine-protein kinase
MTGTVLGNRYTIHEELGTGGMAIVYRANCAYLQRDVAVKVLRPEYRNDTELVNRFESEARAAASLTHPNIVQIYDVGKEGGIDYIVMELVDGKSLKELLTEHGPMPWEMAADVMVKVASALQRAHSKKIVHRDIKPQNILLTSDGEPKVADFGIARIASTGMETMKVDTVASVHYASPEQVRGGYTDAQSDLYSAGVTLYEMLTGELPYAGDNPVTVALRHIQDAIPRADAANPEIPSALADVVETCMQKKRVDRYPDAASLIADLEKVRRQPESAQVQRAGAAPGITNVAVMDDKERDAMRDGLDVPVRRPVSAVADMRFIEEDDVGSSTYRQNRSGRNRKYNPNKLLFPLLYVGLIALIVGLVAGIIRFVTKDLQSTASPTATVSSSTPGRQEFEVGSYRGEPLDKVRESLPEGLKVDIFYIEDATVPRDHVVRQNPRTGSKIVVGGLTTLELFVSAGVEAVVIPEIAGRRQSVLLVELRDTFGLLVEQKFEYHETLQLDEVIRLEPAAGTEVARGSTVLMVVSLGKELQSVSMPDLSNLDRKAAEAKLAEFKLSVGTVTPSDTPQTGAPLTAQSVRPGDLVPEGTTVDLTFEPKPEEPTPTPTTEPTSTPEPTPTEAPLAKVTIPVEWQEDWAGESVQLTAVVYSKESGLDEVILDAKIKQEDFPYNVLITIPEGGGTVKIYVNGNLHKERGI